MIQIIENEIQKNEIPMMVFIENHSKIYIYEKQGWIENIQSNKHYGIQQIYENLYKKILQIVINWKEENKKQFESDENIEARFQTIMKNITNKETNYEIIQLKNNIIQKMKKNEYKLIEYELDFN
jgi:hypothetical protein